MSYLNMINSSIPALDPATALNTLVNSYKEYSIIREQERTKRENIRAYRDINIKAIEESSAILKKFLEEKFSERSMIFREMFKCLDASIASGNSELMSTSIAAIIDIAKQSPLVEARELINNYHNPNATMIEI